MKTSFKFSLFFAVLDTLCVFASLLICVWLKPSFSFTEFTNQYLYSFIVFMGVWILISHFGRKFRISENVGFWKILSSVIISNFIILAIISILIYLFRFDFFSRFIVFGTILTATLLELIVGVSYYRIRKSLFLQDWIGVTLNNGSVKAIKGNENGDIISWNEDSVSDHNGFEQPYIHAIPLKNLKSLRKAIIEECSETAYAWIENHADITSSRTLVLATTTRFNMDNQADNYYDILINLKKINDIQRINKFFESVNAKLPIGGCFIGCGETYGLRKAKILSSYPPVLNYLIYSTDFLLRRVFPKLRLTRKIYFLFSRGKNRVISRTETLGRLYSCGFDVVEEKIIDNLLYWVVKKIREPFFDDHPTFGILIRLRRIGKNGKEFNVYKLRTMHAYSEYVQHYIYKNNQLDEGGKFKDDFRITTLGRIFRKFWLDEFPMLINVIKGDMKIVGVRPLSKQYFNLYSEELQKKRITVKPGLIPPYYAQFPTPKDLNEIQVNEHIYLHEYEKHPFLTDVKYFFKAFNNIIFRKARSK